MHVKSKKSAKSPINRQNRHMKEESAGRILDTLRKNKNGLILANIARLTGVSRVTAKKHLLILVVEGKAKCRFITRTRRKWYYNGPETKKVYSRNPLS